MARDIVNFQGPLCRTGEMRRRILMNETIDTTCVFVLRVCDVVVMNDGG